MIRPAAAAAAGLAIWLAWPAQQGTEGSAGSTRHVSPPLRQAAWPEPAPAGGIEFFSALPPSDNPVPAADSLAATRAHGDPDAPPIGRADPPPDLPTAAELADPKAYQSYEARQSARVFASYVKAVDTELPILRDDIARGRALGVAPEKIAKAEDKVRRLEQMRAQLLKEHPDLAR